jgi:hypothetical protein
MRNDVAENTSAPASDEQLTMILRDTRAAAEGVAYRYAVVSQARAAACSRDK